MLKKVKYADPTKQEIERLSSNRDILPFLTADCSPNPYDVRVYIHEIMRMTNWVLARIPKDQPLVILIGENHTHATNTIAPLLLLKALKDDGHSIDFGYEQSEKMLNGFGHDNIQDFAKKLITGQQLHKEFKSPISTGLIFNYCACEGINIDLGDVAITFDNHHNALVDQSNPNTKDIVKKHAPRMLGKDIIRYSNKSSEYDILGTKLSNLSMFEKASQTIKNSKNKIYVQHCGGDHIVGDESGNLLYNESLHALHEAGGHNVINCFSRPADYPEESITSMSQSVTTWEINNTRQEKRSDELKELKKIDVATQGLVFKR